ncbi:cytochrome P450 4c3-like isoform X1 [Dermacentor andersoni]|uniref:cytochrome P450 4c3-like isoform X1 n=1 Tax=Dermacentor andersoni TaxID=34620 RepID=UPI002155F958|nr:cytochrome P450 4c3-like isoform X1 [Dermacentor andersoni]
MSWHLASSGVLELASSFLKVAALSLVGTLLFVGVIAWIARRIKWKTFRHLNHLPHRKEQVPFQGLWILFKACSPPDSPVRFSTMLFAGICGLHARFQRHGRHLVYVGFTPLLTVYKAEYLEEILSNNKLLSKGRQYKLLHSWLGTGLLTSTGAKWRSRRRLFTPAFHFKILEDFSATINAQSFILCNKLSKLSQHGAKLDVVPLVTLCTLDIICETIMGSSISAQSNEKSPYVAAVNRLGELFLERTMRPLWRLDFIYKLTAFGREYYRCLNVLHSFTRKVIAERKMELEAEVNKGTLRLDSSSESEARAKRRRPFLDLLIVEHLKNDKYITEEDIREEVDTFMFEGHDTTAVGISWALFLIGHHPKEQRKIHEELDLIFGDDRDRHVSFEDLKQMRYLECALKEAQRIYPSVPLIARTCEEPLKIDGAILPTGTVVQMSAYFLHRNPEVFPKPEEFHPERFFPENSKGRHPFAYLPFSAGPRNCIGQRFALAEEKIVIANILRRFTIKSLDQRDQVELVSEMVLRPRSGLRIQFTPRYS